MNSLSQLNEDDPRMTVLKNLQNWGPALLDSLEEQYGKDLIKSMIKDKYLEKLPSPLGQVCVFARQGQKALGYKFMGKVRPSESALMDYLAMRSVIELLETEGYTAPQKDGRAEAQGSKKRTLARMTSPKGQSTYVVVKFKRPTARAITLTIESIQEEVNTSKGKILVFREKPGILAKALERFELAIEVRTPPWRALLGR